MNQTEKFISTIFDGSDDSVKTLTDLFKDGKMITGGKADARRKVDNGHTMGWNREKAIKRAFYAVAIPAAWAAHKPTPIVVGSGPSFQIDARKCFREPPNKYNVGWRCFNGHSYILAGVRDGPAKQCGAPAPSNQCPLQFQWTFEILQGIDNIQNSTDKWGHIKVEDPIMG